MKSESTLRQSGKWTSWTTRQVNKLKRELLEQLDHEPTGRERLLLEGIAAKYGILIVLRRQLKEQPIVDGAVVSSLVDRNLLTWMNALERSVELLLGSAQTKGSFEGLLNADS